MGFRFFISLREEDDSGVRRAEVGERSVGPLGAFTHAKKWQTLREPVMPTDKAVAVRDRTKSFSYEPQDLTFATM